MSEIVPVRIPGADYDVVVCSGLLADAGNLLRDKVKPGRIGVVADSNTAPTHGKKLCDALSAAGFQPIFVTIPAGEHAKNLSTLMPVYDALLGAQIERSTPIIALGGGVVGDMTGFVAATVLRGVPFIQMPTTLLAMVDASIGGKTGVDHAAGKNLIGAFHQPIAVLIDPQTLLTLPPIEFRNGLAECIKHELIRDAEGLTWLENSLDAILCLDMPALTKLIAHNVRIKAKVVEADPLEKGERAHLNFGHTFGHAIESVSKFSLSHGQSVSLGICAASYVSQKLGMLDETSRNRIPAILHRAGLPVRGLTLDIEAVTKSMQFDKKVKSGRIRFVLLEGLGKAVLRDDVPPELAREALMSLK